MKSLHLRAVKMGVLRCACNDYTVCGGACTGAHVCECTAGMCQRETVLGSLALSCMTLKTDLR